MIPLNTFNTLLKEYGFTRFGRDDDWNFLLYIKDFGPVSSEANKKFSSRWATGPLVIEAKIIGNQVSNIGVNVTTLYSPTYFRRFVRDVITGDRPLDVPILFNGNADDQIMTVDELFNTYSTSTVGFKKPEYVKAEVKGVFLETEEEGLKWLLSVFRFYLKFSIDFLNDPQTKKMHEDFLKLYNETNTHGIVKKEKNAEPQVNAWGIPVVPEEDIFDPYHLEGKFARTKFTETEEQFIETQVKKVEKQMLIKFNTLKASFNYAV